METFTQLDEDVCLLEWRRGCRQRLELAERSFEVAVPESDIFIRRLVDNVGVALGQLAFFEALHRRPQLLLRHFDSVGDGSPIDVAATMTPEVDVLVDAETAPCQQQKEQENKN